MAASKSKNPDYIQISGYITRPRANKFKSLCKEKELEISEVLEDLIEKWIEENKE